MVLKMELKIQNYLKELRTRIELWKEYEGVNLKEFSENKKVQDAIMHNMLIAIQSAIDIGSLLIQIKKLELPNKYRDIFIVLGKHKVVSNNLAREISELASFRNALVHMYADINLREVYKRLKTGRKPLEEFYRQILKL